MSTYPSRIVCLTEETTETLYLLGEGDRVAGISGYTVRPPEARRKPKISSFLHARYDKIAALEPDLILAFSDLQAEITTELVKRCYPVFPCNQRSVDAILQMVRCRAGQSDVHAQTPSGYRSLTIELPRRSSMFHAVSRRAMPRSTSISRPRVSAKASTCPGVLPAPKLIRIAP